MYSPLKRQKLEERVKPSPDSLGSSDHEVESDRINVILVSSRVINIDGNDIVKFHINSQQRSGTEIKGGGEGDHVTCYTGIIQALLSSVDAKGIRYAVETLKNFGTSILKDEGKERFDAINEPIVHSKGQREQVRTILNEHLSELSTMVNSELKYYKINQLGSYLSEMASCILVEIQKDPLTSFFSQGRIDKKKNEGDIVKGASYALLAADRLCKLCKLEGERFQEELASVKLGLAPKARNSIDEEDHIMRYGITRWRKMDNGDYANGLLSQLNSEASEERQRLILTQARNELLASSEQIASFMGDLLDYKKEIKFDLEKAIPLSRAVLKRIPEVTQRNEVRIEEMSEIFESDKHLISYDVYNEEVEKERQIITIERIAEIELVEALSKHLQITEAAFPSLCNYLYEQKISKETSVDDLVSPDYLTISRFEKIMDVFLNIEIIEKNGWNSTRQTNSLTAKYLSEQIAEKQNSLDIYKISQSQDIRRR